MKIKCGNKVSLWDTLLDKTILFSFGKSGYYRHLRNSGAEKLRECAGDLILVTGGTSGIGWALAQRLHKEKVDVIITGRDPDKVKKLNPPIKMVTFDLSDWKSIDSAVSKMPIFDHLVFNAGAMPSEYQINDFGVESQAASQLFGHFILLKKIIKEKKLKMGGRVIFVSSGGMLLKKIDLEKIVTQASYDKVATYANVKRGQVILTKLLSQMDEFKNFKFFSMHPGWVDTPAIQSALPLFSYLTKSLLRSPDEGADTIEWLLRTNCIIENGEFYFDRAIANPYPLRSTIETKKEQELLFNLLIEYYKKIGEVL